jgi:outer membrane immunogenic protein
MISPNWILRGEYRYTDYGNFGNTDARNCNACNSASNPLAISYNTHVWSQTATIGIAYKFGGPGVARY